MRKLVRTLWIAALAVPSLPWSSTAIAQGIRQKNGPATLIIEKPLENGRLHISLSDVIDVLLQVEAEDRLEVRVPERITRSPGWEILRSSPPSLGETESKRKWTWRVTLAPLLPGDLSLQIEPLQYRLGDGRTQAAQWQPIAVKVTTVVSQPDLKNLRDSVVIEELPPSQSTTACLWGMAAAVVVGGCILGAWLMWRKRYRTIAHASPDQIVLHDIERILAMRLPEKGQVRAFHMLLANVVRRYLERTLHIPAHRQTTAEFLGALEQSPHVRQEDVEFLSDFLKRCDLAKFAGADVPPAECRMLAERVRRWVADRRVAPGAPGESSFQLVP